MAHNAYVVLSFSRDVVVFLYRFVTVSTSDEKVQIGSGDGFGPPLKKMPQRRFGLDHVFSPLQCSVQRMAEFKAGSIIKAKSFEPPQSLRRIKMGL